MLVSQPAGFTRLLMTALSLAAVFILLRYNLHQSSRGKPRLTEEELGAIERTVQFFAESPIRPPYRERFSELGVRAQQFRAWLASAEASTYAHEKERLLRAVENAAPALFPFLQHSPRKPDSETPLTDLRDSFKPGSKGIVIPTGTGTLRYAYHQIASLRYVLSCALPIEIAYAGDKDLPPWDRERLQARFSGIYFVDVLQVFDDATLNLRGFGWAIKPFAALASSFEEVIVVDADAVFLQPPDILLAQEAYASTGALLFHDRLLWKDVFKARHAWWRSQITHPSATLNKSLAFMEDYGEECDSGVVVLDKSRLGVLVGLLHTAWQNSKDARETTYLFGYGDKESWWFGLELTGSPYAFEEHYASIVGWLKDPAEKGSGTVCGFGVAHVDEHGKLLWYNGSLLKNKGAEKKTFGVPTHWMVDGTWTKLGKSKISCMEGKEPVELSEDENAVLRQSVGLAQRLDEEFGFGFG